MHYLLEIVCLLFSFDEKRSKICHLEERDVGSSSCPHFGQRKKQNRTEQKIGDGDECGSWTGRG